MGVPSWARVGARVVCIDDNWNDGEYLRLLGYEPPARVPMLYEVLTIRETHVFTYGIGSVCALYFDELPPFGYNSNSFRPLVDDTADDEIEARIFRSKHHPVSETEAV